ncbi:Uncharacterised protein [uncultured archaeon]|nr:Uncharacterised protein [uncultured archaeon]
MTEERTANEAYLEGRLIGLNQLITILKENIEEEESSPAATIKSIVEHISNEMDSIIAEMADIHGEKHPVISSATKKTNTINKEIAKQPEEQETLKKQVMSTDQILKNLIELQKAQQEGK